MGIDSNPPKPEEGAGAAFARYAIRLSPHGQPLVASLVAITTDGIAYILKNGLSLEQLETLRDDAAQASAALREATT